MYLKFLYSILLKTSFFLPHFFCKIKIELIQLISQYQKVAQYFIFQTIHHAIDNVVV